MNERIRECWIKAAESIAAYPSGQNNSWETQVNFLDKFAELIVRECYEECKGQMLPKGMAEEHGLNYNDGVMDCAIGLLQHFGVE
jgi:hypothetical protein